MSATIRDVADAAGVSIATVSRALHGDPKVRPATAARVREAASRLRYAPSPAAARLARRRAGHVTFLAHSADVAALGDCLAATARELRRHDLDVLLDVIADGDEAAAIERLRGRTDAVVLAPSGPIRHERLLLGLGVPCVLLGQQSAGVASVLVDPAAVGELAAHHLLALGHRRVAVLAPLVAGSASPDAVAVAFERAARARDRDIDVQRLIPAYDDVESAERATAALLSMPQPPTALFAATEHGTTGATRAFLRHGRMPGEHVALVGAGGEQLAADLGLTLVATPADEVGRAVGTLVARLLDGSGGIDVVALAPQLVVRGSTWRPASSSVSA